MVFRAATRKALLIRHGKKMCAAAGIEGKFTNHSLRATGATALFQSEAPEKVIQEFTGLRSVKALRQYEKVASQQKQAACNILNGGAPARSFSTEVEKLHSVQQPPNILSPQVLFSQTVHQVLPLCQPFHHI